MGKKAKVGKSRKDKFYHLAKETGYRSRAAFKLIQLNRKYEFLQRSNVIVDLCAAPGGWLQVAAENAPMSNHIIGIDLVSIPPIHNVKTFQEDITTEKCRQVIKKELHTLKADCFLNDGAPNVGKNWVHDAYQQAELTLHAMKLATDFLRKGGWFVTKLFRSKDYDALMWVFQQLFKEVHATKPQASRNESAEIFVVCQGYLAPDKIDPKFTDPKHVFKEVDTTQRVAIDLIHPEKKKRQREGYPEGDYTLFHSLPVTKFFDSEDFMDLLAESSEIALDSEEIKNHPLTTSEIKECIKDIKVLGKKDIKSVFLWRKKLKKELEKSGSSQQFEASVSGDVKEEGEEEIQEDGQEDEAEMEELENLLEAKNQEELKAMKKVKKKVRKAQMKQKARIDLKMTIPGDRPDIQDDENIFDIRKIRSKTELVEVEKGDLSHMDSTDIFEDSDDERPKKRKREYFDKDEKKYIGIEGGGESDEDEEEEMEEEPMFDDGSEEEEEEEDDSTEKEESSKENANPLIIDMEETSRIKKDKQNAWFKKAAFAGLEDDFGEDLDLENLGSTNGPSDKRKTTDKQEKSKSESKDSQKTKKSNGFEADSDDEMKFESDDEEKKEEAEDDDDEDEDSDSDYDFGGFPSTLAKKRKKQERAKVGKDGVEVVPLSVDPSLRLDEEGLAIGAAMVQSRKRRREIVDAGFHRYMFDDDNLPEWFASDERKHLKRQRPVSKEEMEEYKLKMKAVDAQPIKKIAEAKARKKRKMLKRQEKARKKANAVTENIDVSEKEKWQQIKQIYKKAGLLKKSKPSVTYVVAKKGAGKKVRRPAGVKGQFKVVDSRMKKDVRAQMKVDARKKGKMKTGKKGGGRARR
ncbi:pre-rRNA 2'-O-ribose RNA methyltransferase FTSJ3 [Aplysia californica]|uniref:Putative rRNA methyltransferase n=2 Tax=Bilateria TaxID=33213 RepID=A0ABM1A449_APLCA|nr:pre-rRNA 2'-O-ribose RNA methyltransferase FTSJ3 [Aplysia californica]